MKRLFGLFLILSFVSLFIIGCGETAETKKKFDDMNTALKNLETKVSELTTKVDSLVADYQKHLDEFHKKAEKPAAKTAPKPKAVRPPRIGR